MISHNSLVNFNTHAQIIDDLGQLLSTHDLEIDSRNVGANSIFCAYPGSSKDGRDYIEQALAQGAVAIIYEACANALTIPTPNIQVHNLMYYVGLLAAHKYQNPTEKFHTIGVTGTNGKTSITHWLNQIYTNLGCKTAIIGTTGTGVYNNIIDCAVTTPDPITLQRQLAKFAQAKVEVLAMEVSSHALHQGRVNGVAFKSAVFTNLSQDHFDYHKTMEAYYLAKRDLFYWHGLEHAIINADDEYGQRLISELAHATTKYKPPLEILTYGINSGDLQATNLHFTLSGTSFNLKYKNKEYPVQVSIIAKFNVYNILATIGTLLINGHKLDEILPLLSKLQPVCGRMDTIILKNRPLVVIDYAHTPDALFNALTALKSIGQSGKLYCVVGCGGNRDQSKRPIMGDIATNLADFTYITSDNPRFEKPEDIIAQIVSGVSATNYTVIVERELAIGAAIANAQANDIILIAGKGHETYQDTAGEKKYFSDKEIARHCLENL